MVLGCVCRGAAHSLAVRARLGDLEATVVEEELGAARIELVADMPRHRLETLSAIHRNLTRGAGRLAEADEVGG